MNAEEYVGGDTLLPGEVADDDPIEHERKEYCPECDSRVEPLVNECPLCGIQLN